MFILILLGVKLFGNKDIEVDIGTMSLDGDTYYSMSLTGTDVYEDSAYQQMVVMLRNDYCVTLTASSYIENKCTEYLGYFTIYTEEEYSSMEDVTDNDSLHYQNDEEFQIGQVTANTYENKFFGIKCIMDDSWVFYTDKEIAELNNLTMSLLEDDLVKAYENSDVFIDMYVRSKSSYNNINVSGYKMSDSDILDFDVEKNTLKLMNSLKQELSELSAERVFKEMEIALKYDKPSKFFDVLKLAGVLEVHFLEIYKLIGALQPEKYHPEGDSYNHTMLALNRCAEHTKNEKIRFAVLVHDLGKGVTPKNEYPHHINHDKNGVEQVKKFANRLKDFYFTGEIPKIPSLALGVKEVSVKEIIKKFPEHISVYSLIVEENTKMFELIENNCLELPSEELERKMYWKVKKNLEEYGYKHCKAFAFNINLHHFSFS